MEIITKMNNKLLKIFTLMIGFSLMASSLFAQDKQLGVTYYGNDTPMLGKDKTTNVSPIKETSPQVKALVQLQRQAKLAGDNTRVLDIQRQIDALTGESVTVAATQIAGEVRFVGTPVSNQTDNIINNEVFITPAGTFLKATATAIEQRGSGIGKIWLDVAYGSNNNTSPDTIITYYSTNGGTAWVAYSVAIFGGNAKVNNDEIDMEIMEYTTGQKYVWSVLGVTASTGQSVAVGIIYQTPTYAGNIFQLTWPGGSGNTNVFRPRVTSDNATYNTNSSWLFMIAERDTLISANTWSIGEKFAKCTNPFTVTPTFTYKSRFFYYDGNYGGPGTYYKDADHCDIAYYQNGGQDSLMVLESNLPDTTVIYGMKSDESPEADGVIGAPTLNGGGLSTGYQKQYARVTSNGNGSNMIMIVYRDNYTNSGDWDIDYARSNNGGIPAGSWANGYVDGFASTVTYPFQPDLTGLRGTSSFKCSYVYFNSGIDSAMIISAPNGTWQNNPTRVSLSGQDISVSASSHAGYRFVNNDSCLVAWSNYPANNLWVSVGCTGAVVTAVNHNNNGVPTAYSLLQNYPNPFNPSTNIKFALPKAGIVKLVVYDLLGSEVATLVNKNMNAGSFSVDFDASNLASGVYFYKLEANGFSDVKKMMLIK
jgi:hypothetical protein